MPLGLIVVATVLAHAAFNGSRLNMSLLALSMGASPFSSALDPESLRSQGKWVSGGKTGDRSAGHLLRRSTPNAGR